MDVRAFRSQMSVPKCLFSKVSRGCPKFLTQDIRANDSGTSVGWPENFLFGLLFRSWIDFKSRISGTGRKTKVEHGNLGVRVQRAKKAHKLFSHKLSVPPFVPGLSLGQTGFVPGTNPVRSGFHCVNKVRRKPGCVPSFHRISEKSSCP